MVRGGIQTRPVITDKHCNGQLTMTRIKTRKGHQGTLNQTRSDLIVQARGVIVKTGFKIARENFENKINFY